MYRQSKKMLNSNISSTCPHNMVNFGPLTAEFRAPQQISTGFASWLRCCTGIAQRRSTKLCTTFGRLLGWYTIHTFWGLLPMPPNEILPGAKFTLCPSLAFSYIGSVTARHSSNERQPNFAAWDNEGIYELSLLVCAIYIPQGGHHVGCLPHSSY